MEAKNKFNFLKIFFNMIDNLNIDFFFYYVTVTITDNLINISQVEKTVCFLKLIKAI